MACVRVSTRVVVVTVPPVPWMGPQGMRRLVSAAQRMGVYKDAALFAHFAVSSESLTAIRPTSGGRVLSPLRRFPIRRVPFRRVPFRHIPFRCISLSLHSLSPHSL